MFRTILKTLLLLMFLAGPVHAQSAGTMSYDTAANEYKFYDGVSWRRFNTGLALVSCSKTAEMEYVPLLSYYRYCNGTKWVPIVGLVTLSTCTGPGKMDFFSSSFFYCNGLFWVNMSGSIV